MDPQQYIVTDRRDGAGDEGFGGFLAAAEHMAGVTIKKVHSRYVVFEAPPAVAETLAQQVGTEYQITPNSELNLYG
ncbi:hypothetical protein [Geodermatophilus sp. DSM 45219]|uniref:hypothetical protein n=1 Tax=Geodermatophilus sp. DSM 45219 TaxID=1881103 RepID=UPI000890ECD0|nr:hypothetical protein [Geodermatophilus sp. DSM 45219]SDN95736.1 hypothetical protein SAMN05428965_2095 [Geodermatophilus sp. DSM 45219]